MNLREKYEKSLDYSGENGAKLSAKALNEYLKREKRVAKLNRTALEQHEMERKSMEDSEISHELRSITEL
jgi:hypothetical protein